MTISEALGRIRADIAEAARQAGRDAQAVRLVAVSKTFPQEDVREAIAAGQRVFGENRVQEAMQKFPALRAEFADLELHLIGPLQSNKAREAVALFDVIHTVDRDKIAGALAAEMRAQGRTPQLLVQVNTGEEPQKAGIAPREAVDFVARCRTEHGLAIAGLMCIPPVGDIPALHFALLDELCRRAGVAERSMGMSQDYETAVRHGATLVRVGSAIFGHRDYPA
ncbi:YggS family pyridoxal phosphate-dependent enzyme [Oryzibacter oryziterrae]|uniref:YggS family pyridoxal phosphate-dependent enzyme n=1 Tax=Oryzibacter oryziterrae TaxID=2766474 RepID=UPI001F001542|nr:YggS family pyridoxal phosphate-dependent enzyme [Oryzibacter oryziterrae]